jgi:hypothetical protein
MSEFAHLSPDAQGLRNKLLLLLLDLHHKKDSILLSPIGEYQQDLEVFTLPHHLPVESVGFLGLLRIPRKS